MSERSRCQRGNPVFSHRADGSSAEDEQQLAPISIEPRAGVIEAGKIQVFNVDFSPVKVSQYQGRLVCRYALSFPLLTTIATCGFGA